MGRNFSAIKASVLKRKLNKIQPIKEVDIRPADTYKNILFIEENLNPSTVDYLKSVFPNAKTSTLTFRQKKEDESSANSYFVHDSDFNLSGHLKNVKLTELLNQSFDLVLDLSRNSVPLSYIISSLKPGLIVSAEDKTLDHASDLKVAFGSSGIDFINNVKKQLNLLSGHGH